MRNINVRRRAEIGQERRARTRAQIQSAAFELLGRRNGLFTSIDEICRAASISRGTFYNYFASTQELFESLSFDLSHDFVDAVLSVTNEMPDAAERTAAAVRYYLDRAAKDPQWGWGVVNISVGGLIFGAETHAAALKTIALGIEAGVFTVATADLGRDLCLGVSLAAIMTQLDNKQPQSFSQEVAKSILVSLGVSPKRASGLTRKKLPAIE